MKTAKTKTWQKRVSLKRCFSLMLNIGHCVKMSNMPQNIKINTGGPLYDGA